MLLKHYHLLKLGKYTRIASSVEFLNSRPSVYTRHKDHNEKRSDRIVTGLQPVPESDTMPENLIKTPKDYYDDYISGEEYEEYLDRLIMESKKNRRKENGQSSSLT
jgi:hypothetical protein